ncbi:MAG: NAD-binding protein [Chloroflexota bacterium]
MTHSAPRPGLRERASYRFDRFMERGTIALVLGLAVVSLGIILGITLVMTLLGANQPDPNADPLDFITLGWMALMRTLDAGTMGGDSGPWPFLLGMLAVTIGGIFVISTLIGILSSGLEGKLDDLRRGRSRVLEHDHVLILGWNQHVFAVIKELVTAGLARPRTRIVVMADQDRTEMERAIRERVEIPKRVRIVCRSGMPSDLADLPIANPDASRAIVVLGPDGESDDVAVLKTILALTGRKGRRSDPYRIVAEVRRPTSVGIAKLIGGDEVHLVQEDDLLARIIAQTCRQSGLSVVYQELLDFEGNEFHVEDLPEAVGMRFGDLVARAVHGIPSGIVRDGQAQLNPSPDEVIQPSDRVVVLSEDAGHIRLGDPAIVDAAAIVATAPADGTPERTLILGWNARGPIVIRELDQYVAPGSDVLVVSALPRVAHEAGEIEGLAHMRIEARVADTTSRAVLDRLDVASFAHVVVLCESDDRSTDVADGRTVVTLLHLRDIGAKRGKPFSIVSEMLDVRNRELAEVAQADDFIVSAKVLSSLLAQIAETPDLADVFRDLFDADGAELYVREAGEYVGLDREVAFATVQAAAQARREVAVGYRVAALSGDQARAYGVVLCPSRDARLRFAAGDRIVVLAES